MSRDQKFFDMYSLVIGVLVVAAIGIFVLAMKMSDLTQGVYTRDADEYQAAVEERIRPVGQVFLPAEEAAAAADDAAAIHPYWTLATLFSSDQGLASAAKAVKPGGSRRVLMADDNTVNRRLTVGKPVRSR